MQEHSNLVFVQKDLQNRHVSTVRLFKLSPNEQSFRVSYAFAQQCIRCSVCVCVLKEEEEGRWLHLGMGFGLPYSLKSAHSTQGSKQIFYTNLLADGE